MNLDQFQAHLADEGYQVITTVAQPIGYALGDHHHGFDACALILEGDFTITVDGQARHYTAGDIFRLPAGTLHSEHAGPHGVKYLAGRRTKELA
ncbi:MAG: cupin domain-containing protein [Betaproteobacteria bacterium]